MVDAMVTRGFAARTQESYVEAISRMARHYQRSPALLSKDEVSAYLLDMVSKRQPPTPATRLSVTRRAHSLIGANGKSSFTSMTGWCMPKPRWEVLPRCWST
jgi:hypothetical protein